jgi:hypothetical protein
MNYGYVLEFREQLHLTKQNITITYEKYLLLSNSSAIFGPDKSENESGVAVVDEKVQNRIYVQPLMVPNNPK